MQYEPIEVSVNGKNYTGTVSKLPPAFIPGEQSKESRYLFVFENWDGKGPGMLIIEQASNIFRPHETSPIKDGSLAFAAGESLKKIM